MKDTQNVFPYKICGDDGITTVYKGLTVRDYIAIQAMTGLSANPGQNERSFEDITDMAYKQADAMLKQSEVPHV